MEWLLILFWIGPSKGGITTERFPTYIECSRVGDLIKKDKDRFGSSFDFKCIEVKKLER